MIGVFGFIICCFTPFLFPLWGVWLACCPCVVCCVDLVNGLNNALSKLFFKDCSVLKLVACGFVLYILKWLCGLVFGFFGAGYYDEVFVVDDYVDHLG